MLKEKVLEVSPEEQAARAAEARAATAEGQYVIILADIKRVREEQAIIEEKIKQGKDKIDSLNDEIVSLGKNVIECQKSLNEENQKFNEVVAENKVKVKKLDDEITSREKTKRALNQEITDIKDLIRMDKVNSQKELDDLEDKKRILKSDIKALDIQKENTERAVFDSRSSIKTLERNIETKSDEYSNLNRSLSMLRNEVEAQQDTIEVNHKAISELKKTIADKEVDLSVWVTKIDAKEQEYRNLELKAFAILTREEKLASKEAFIKSKFEQAGIEYEN